MVLGRRLHGYHYLSGGVRCCVMVAAMSQALTKCKAQTAGMCGLCGTAIYIGDDICLGSHNDIPCAAHEQCVAKFPAEALEMFDNYWKPNLHFQQDGTR